MARSITSRGWRNVGILAILFLAFLLRVSTLDQSSLWLDEIYSYRRASQTSWESIHQQLTSSGHAPLFDGILLHAWLRLGRSEFFLRFLPTCFGILTIATVYTLGRALAGSTVGLLSALAVTLSPFHIAYSQEVRMYTLAFLWTSLGMYLFLKAAFSQGPAARRLWVFYAICVALGLYTHYMTAFVFLVLFLLGLARACLRGDLLSVRPLLLSQIAAALLFAPWVPTFWAQIRSPCIMWVPKTSVSRLYNQFARIFLYDMFLGGFYLPLVILMLVVFLAGVAAGFRRSAGSDSAVGVGKHLFAVASAAGPLGVLVLVSFFKPMVVDRYIFVIAPAVFVLFALGIAELLKHRATVLISLAVTAGVVFSAWSVVTTDLKEDWESVANYISDRSSSEDVVVFATSYLKPVLSSYYDVPLTLYGVKPQLNSRSARRVFNDLQGLERAWVITTSRFQIDPALIDYLETEYDDRLVSCREFGDASRVSVCLYARNGQ